MEEALSLGSRLGRFEIVRPLGRGGAGAVFLARAPGPEGFEKQFALKVLHPAAGARSALIEEAKVLQGLHHSNVVQVFELGREDGLDFVAMEYVEGVSLDDLILADHDAGLGLPAGIALYIGAEVCKALHFVHGRCDGAGQPLGLVHRDVSPANILLSWAGEVKLADFGIAKGGNERRHGETEPGVVKGKLGYMAPEQAAGGIILDGRADLYAAALSAYESLTGDNPLLGLTDVETYQRSLDPSVTPPSRLVPGIGDDVDAFFERALAKRREDRFETAAEMRRALEELEPVRSLATADVALAEHLASVRDLASARAERSLAEAARSALGSDLRPARDSEPRAYPRTAVMPRRDRATSPAKLGAVVLLLAVLGAGGALVLRNRDDRSPVDGKAPLTALTPVVKPLAPVVEPAPRVAAVPAALSPGPAEQRRPDPPAAGLAKSASERRPSEAPDEAQEGRRPRAGPPRPRAEAAVPVAPGAPSPIDGRHAVIQVNVDPWAEVLIDGKNMGNVPKRLKVAPGRHVVTLRNPEMKMQKSLTVELAPGGTETISKWPD